MRTQRLPSLLIGLSFGLILTLFLARPASSQEVISPGEDARSQGVESYLVTTTDSTSYIELYGATSVPVSDLTIETMPDANVSIAITETTGNLLRLEWNRSQGLVRLSAVDSGQSGTASFDLQNAKWVETKAYSQLLARHKKSFELAAIVFSNLEAASPDVSPPPIAADSQCSSVGNGLLADGGGSPQEFGIACNGMHTRGFAVSAAASECCAEAHQDASEQCTNGICWGCCAFRMCDFSCAIGRYLCFCGVTGISCSFPDF